MKYRLSSISILIFLLSLFSCIREKTSETETMQDSIPAESLENSPNDIAINEQKKEPEPVFLTAQDIQLRRELLFDKYILEDTYPYRDTVRSFQWQAICDKLAFIENMQQKPVQWVVFENYKNINGEAPTILNYTRNEYNRITDSLGIERFQSVPLYSPTGDIGSPKLYGQDGTLAKIVDTEEDYYLIEPILIEGQWLVPKNYIRELPDSTSFQHIVVVDRIQQNIATLERESPGNWLIRSTNPATTGRFKPPYAQKTPLGIFLLQQKKRRMHYFQDGTREIEGYAPYASRFTNGAYIHGIPVVGVDNPIKEHSPTLGTTPRSHMCVRNNSSHAEFIYKWAPLRRTLVIVIE
ncbi:hypothetical protein HQ45_04760 [Porphyromonas crevioricanis]|uniref:L,D-TPase catalytic domain-containing protein n=2 Tax=Porphyromonas crevioricanis TaxID=393921 RepID=A0AB34PI29_9PORP|nr:L,D-transpeptidase [Porphyromonas crevioricanis]KGN90116.1 hypothetical protein HQ45_04760 [Porphyromonas crevioricanis]KGN94870.1 hypothetical protein HQ38_04920 [Porphyromonas crevioricanis]GAD08554.1 hypothetical protein PORCAN_2202 [Porphyromonas crevioricanis JCM 13913]